jgi:hypothetical protein
MPRALQKVLRFGVVECEGGYRGRDVCDWCGDETTDLSEVGCAVEWEDGEPVNAWWGHPDCAAAAVLGALFPGSMVVECPDPGSLVRLAVLNNRVA